ncbi:MAG: hypothetical protein AAGJ89_02210 [Pseudomonadota bacterium]
MIRLIRGSGKIGPAGHISVQDWNATGIDSANIWFSAVGLKVSRKGVLRAEDEGCRADENEKTWFYEFIRFYENPNYYDRLVSRTVKLDVAVCAQCEWKRAQ